MATTSTEFNNAELARLIKQGVIFLRPRGTTDIPEDIEWVPNSDTKKCALGYYSEDGFTLTPNPGDETTILGHNKDEVVSEMAPGSWAPAFTGLESNNVAVSSYFDTEIGEDGSITVSTAATSKRYDLVTYGEDQKGNVIIIHYPNVQLSAREALTFNATTLVIYGMTFKTFKGTGDQAYHFKAYGLVQEEEPPVVGSETWSIEITGTPTGGDYILSVNGIDSAAIAYNANNTAIQSAINDISGVAGATVTGTAVKTITFTAPVMLTADAGGLTGGTTPDVVVTEL